MKYCPRCGGSVIDGAAFCVDCGRNLPATRGEEKPASNAMFEKQNDGVPYAPKNASKQSFDSKQIEESADEDIPEEWEDDIEVQPDHYYDDIPAEQQTVIREGPDQKLILRIAILGCAAAGILILGVVAAMYL